MLMFEGSGFRQVREMHFYLEILRSSILISTYNKLYTSKSFYNILCSLIPLKIFHYSLVEIVQAYVPVNYLEISLLVGTHSLCLKDLLSSQHDICEFFLTVWGLFIQSRRKIFRKTYVCVSGVTNVSFSGTVMCVLNE